MVLIELLTLFVVPAVYSVCLIHQ